MTERSAVDADLVAIVTGMADGASMSSILTALDGRIGDRTARRRITAHLLEPGHGERFVALLDHHRPSWREARAELNELPLGSGERAVSPPR